MVVHAWPSFLNLSQVFTSASRCRQADKAQPSRVIRSIPMDIKCYLLSHINTHIPTYRHITTIFSIFYSHRYLHPSLDMWFKHVKTMINRPIFHTTHLSNYGEFGSGFCFLKPHENSIDARRWRVSCGSHVADPDVPRPTPNTSWAASFLSFEAAVCSGD